MKSLHLQLLVLSTLIIFSYSIFSDVNEFVGPPLPVQTTEEEYPEGDEVEIEEPTAVVIVASGKSSASSTQFPPQSFCDDQQRCQNIDEVWYKKIGIFITPEHKDQIWDPRTTSWKTFQEVYAPPPPPPSLSSGAPSATSNYIKFPESCNCFELALFSSSQERETKVVPIAFQGQTIKVNPIVAPLFKKIDSEITAANTGYAFKRITTGKWRCVGSPVITIVDHTTCLTNKGKIARSKHSYGIAIDINPLDNPFCVNKDDGKYYQNGNECRHTLPQKIIDIFKANDFRWGGDWKDAKDYMHFDWKGNRGDFNGDGIVEECGSSTPILASTSLSSTPSPASLSPPPPPSGNIKFSFAVISDTPDGDCDDPGSSATSPITQGEAVSKAKDFINSKKPAFVISAGDLTSGECSANNKKVGQSLAIDQLNEFKNVFLDGLTVPFVPLAGNHDFFKSTSPNIWYTFWDEQTNKLLPAYNSRQTCGSSTISKNNLVSRFEYNGKGFVLINPGYIGHKYGLPQEELDCINQLAKPGDLVFRHVSPFGVSCEAKNPSTCGRSVLNPSGDVTEVEQLPQLLKQKNIAALYAGHTHAL